MDRILITADWIIPVDRSPIKDGAILIEDSQIIAVDRRNNLEDVENITRKLGGQGTWVMPGFINTHYHNGRSFQMGFSEEPGETGLFRTFSQGGFSDIEQARTFSYLNTLVSATQLIKSGITTTIDMAWGGKSTGIEHDFAIKAYTNLGLSIVFAPIARDRAAYVYGDDDEFLAMLPAKLAQQIKNADLGQSDKIAAEDYIEEWSDLRSGFANDLTHLIVALDGPVWCSDELSIKLSNWAIKQGCPLHMHNAESKLEVDWALNQLGKTSTRHLYDLNILVPHTSFAHGTWLSEEDIELCVDKGITIAHTPSSDLHWYCGIAPIAVYLMAGMNVSIGTDGSGFSEDHDFLTEMRIASLLQRVPGDLDWPGLKPDEAIKMATINGAKAFGLEERIGTITPGKRADLILLDGDRLRGKLVNPLHDVQDVLIQRGKTEHVMTVIVAGKILLEDGKITPVNEEEAVIELRGYYEVLWNMKDEHREKIIGEGLKYVRDYFKPWETKQYPPRYRFNRI